MLGLQCPLAHRQNQILRCIDGHDHLGQNKTERHLGVIRLQRPGLVRFGDDCHLQLRPQALFHFGQRAPPRLQAEDLATTMSIQRDLPGQIALGVDTLLTCVVRQQKWNDKRDKDEGDQSKGKFHGSGAW